MYSPRSSRSRLALGADGNALVMLILILVTVFIMLALVKLIYFFSGNSGTTGYDTDIYPWVALPAHLGTLVTRPWTLLTHFLVHNPPGNSSGIWHILGNLIWLWSFGFILQDLTGPRRVIPLFLYGAVAGALAFLLAYNLLPPLLAMRSSATAIGASAGVMAIAIGTTVLAPGYRIFPMLNGGIPLWVLTLIFVIIDLATIPYNNPGGHIAHLGGGLAGLLFMLRVQRGGNPGGWIHRLADWFNGLMNPSKPAPGQSVRERKHYSSEVPPFRKTGTTITQQRVDEILEKIHQKGYNALTQAEKDLLKKASGGEG